MSKRELPLPKLLTPKTIYGSQTVFPIPTTLIALFFLSRKHFKAETLGMEGNITERRLSVAVTPLWLDSSNNTLATPTIPAAPQDNREIKANPEVNEDGLPPIKVQIQTPDFPRIQLAARHPKAENFENTEVEELIAMLRETENLEEQGDILQYLVDTEGLDFNTGNLNFRM